jgi:hypothetical protein
MNITNTEIPLSKLSGYGPGGRKCNCCGPSPKNRKKNDRAVKRGVKAKIKKEILNDLN